MKRVLLVTMGLAFAVAALNAKAQETETKTKKPAPQKQIQPAQKTPPGAWAYGMRPRNATGPRAQMGICPQVDGRGQQQVAPANRGWNGRGAGNAAVGRGYGRGAGRMGQAVAPAGRGMGIGPRNATGPRAQMGICPQVDGRGQQQVAPANRRWNGRGAGNAAAGRGYGRGAGPRAR
ncbi:MAG: hypothetical protein K9N48_04110 [Verrucomicrobia bacterium]|nr:hypothetical protein [Verrucomicrobiota bacterium]